MRKLFKYVNFLTIKKTKVTQTLCLSVIKNISFTHC